MVKRYCMPDPTQALTDEVIMAQIAPGSRVIDLGCGDGRLLRRLHEELQCSILGVEVDRERILGAIANGIPVIQADLDRRLPDIPDGTFDFAVLSQTLQQVRYPKEVLQEMLRVARRALVVVPNFGHWRVRLQMLFYGRAPVTNALPYNWYNTPNLHLLTMHDFRDLAASLNFHVVKEITIIHNKAVDRAWGANLRAESAMYVLERNGV